MEIDILSLDQKIQDQLRNEEEKVKIYKERLRDIEELLSKKNIEDELKTKLTNSQYDYKLKIKNIEAEQNYNFYLNESMCIVQRYREILKKPIKLSFVTKTKPESNQEKMKLINDFLALAKKYISIEKDDGYEKKEICTSCLSKNLVYSENAQICLSCGMESMTGANPLSYRDISRINILQKYTYERRSHFRDCINQFQGKQNCKIPDTVYQQLEEQFLKHNLLHGDNTTPKEIRYAKVQKEHILLFLKELRQDKHYENVNYIYSQLTGIRCPDISHIEEQLMTDFDTLVNLYIKKFKYERKIQRKSFMNIHYVFYQLLNKNKFFCKKEEFNILKTIDRKTFHDDVFKELFEELGWNHVPFF